MGLAEADRLGLCDVEIVIDQTISTDAYANVVASFQRETPRFHSIPGLGGATGPVAIVGGGPSLRTELGNLRRFPGPVISCGTSHDYLIASGVIPSWHVDGEPDADRVMLRWLRHPCSGTTYLVASQCPSSMFEALDGFDVRLWHLAVSENPDDGPDFHGEPSIPGAHFIVGRAWPIAAILGHTDIHFFGFDCSFPADCAGQHAYPYDWTTEEPCRVWVEHGEGFTTTPALMGQLQVFTKMLAQAQGKFTVTVHGDGLAAAVLRRIV